MNAGAGADDEEVGRQNPHLLLICAAWGCWACILMVIVIFCAAATSDSEALGACSADIDSAAVLIFTLGTVAVLAVTVYACMWHPPKPVLEPIVKVARGSSLGEAFENPLGGLTRGSSAPQDVEGRAETPRRGRGRPPQRPADGHGRGRAPSTPQPPPQQHPPPQVDSLQRLRLSSSASGGAAAPWTDNPAAGSPAARLDPQLQPEPQPQPQPQLRPPPRLEQLQQRPSALEELFRKYDTNGDGVLDMEEVAAMIDDIGYDVDQNYIAGTVEIFGQFDADGNGTISLDEFEALWAHLGQESVV